MSRRAISVALAGVALTLVALTFGTAPLLVPGIAFAVLGIAMPAAVWLTGRGMTIRRELDVRRVVEDEPLEAKLTVSGTPRRLISAELVEPLAPTPIGLAPAQGEEPVRIVFCLHGRGMRRIPPPSLVLTDPLELCRRVIPGTGPPSEVLVLPRISEVRAIGASDGRGSEATGARPEALAAVDLDGLRPYRPGTSAARIYWPAVARGAGLLERRLSAEVDTRPLVVLDTRNPSGADDEPLDAAVRAAASLTLALAKRGGCGLILPGDRRPTAISPDLISWPAAHARLALVEGGPDVPAPGLSSSRVRIGPIFYVAARAMRRIPAAAGSAVRGSGVLVMPASVLAGPDAAGPAARPIFEVSGCYGFGLGTRRDERRRRTRVLAGSGRPGASA